MTESVAPTFVAPTRPLAHLHSTCRVCGGSSFELFFELPAVPVHCNILWPTEEAARCAPMGAIALALCQYCGLVFNAAFQPELVTYDEAYENSLHHSPRFEAYAGSLARDLSDRLHLEGQLVVEVGCGKGEFLRRLCRTAGARGLGVDASYDPRLAPAEADDSVTFLQQPFTRVPVDIEPALMLCRHVLEHLPNPGEFVEQFAAVARRSKSGRVFLEVPHVLFTLKDLGIWDIIYEHCSYFSVPSLSRLCELAGLNVERAYPTYGNQFLCVEATPGSIAASDHDGALAELRSLTEAFSAEYVQKVSYWQSRLASLRAKGQRVALWGAGSKGITFVNTVPGGSEIACLVDLNPRKHGRFVPGTGQPVVGPESLRQIAPDHIIVMNPLYSEEIERMVAQLGLGATIEVA
jgi:SAM-dependent methyltransferase